jgi:hypothetical protein
VAPENDGRLIAGERQAPDDGPDSDDDEPQEEKPEAKRSLADKVEDTIRAVLDFVRAYAHTIRFALSPKRLSEYPPELHKSDKKLIRPLTFLCTSYIPAAVILDLSSDTIWDFLLSPETAASKIVERVETISPLKVVLGSIPVLIAIYLGSAVLSRLLVKRTDKRAVFTDGMCYAYGMQFFGLTVLLVLMSLSHTRISEQVIDPRVLKVLQAVFANIGIFYLILFASVLYPFVISVRLLREIEPSHRSWHQSLLPITGVVMITLSTYWLGVLPSKFRNAISPEKIIEAELIDDKLKIVPDKSPELDMRVLVRNPTQHLVLIPVTGLTVRLKLSFDGTVIPRNAFHSQLINTQNAPFLILRADDATWADARIFPDSRDWQLLENNQAKGGGIELELSVRDSDGKEIRASWRDVTLEGTWPTPPVVPPQS